MQLKLILCIITGCFLVVFLGISLIFPFPSAYVMDLSNRFSPPSQAHLLGIDELGRDLFSRFVVGIKHTVLTGLVTALVAGASGWLIFQTLRAAPNWIGRAVVILTYVCFVLPSFLLSFSWKGRLLTAALCALGILPVVLLALVLMVIWPLPAWAGSFALGPLFGIGVADSLRRARCLHKSAASRHRGGSILPLYAIMTSVFVWAVYWHAMLDGLGLGVQPPEPSWGTMLVGHSASWWPNVIAGLGLATIGLTAFAFGDVLSRPAKRGPAISTS